MTNDEKKSHRATSKRSRGPSKHDFEIAVDKLPERIEAAAMRSGGFPYDDKLKRKPYARDLRILQTELLKMLSWVKHEARRVVIVMEGRDAAGKGGAITRLTQHLNPRSVRIVALPKPTDEEARQWYFQRYIAHMPPCGEIAIFDRSWYNRAGVERVFGFCTPAQTDKFLTEAPAFEALLARDGILIIKFFLSIGREMQMKRLHARWHDPLQRWKLSDLDFKAIAKWDDYSAAFEQMLSQTDSAEAPWTVIRANDKRRARLEIIRHILSVLPYSKKDEAVVGAVDQKIVMSASAFLGSGGEQE